MSVNQHSNRRRSCPKCRKCKPLPVPCAPCGPCAPLCPPCPPPCLPPCPPPCPPPCDPKDPCPLKAFCDPGLGSGCTQPPLIDVNSPRRAVTTWRIVYLSSNIPEMADNQDVDMVNPWGIIVYNNQLWVVCNGTDLITNYDLFGHKLTGRITVRNVAHNVSHPTGIAINCYSGGFTVTTPSGNFIATNGGRALTKSAQFLTASEQGTVSAFNATIDNLNAYVVLNTQLTGEVTVYKGLAIANNTLFIADFFRGHIDVFDSYYNRLLGYHFIDSDTADPIPLDFGPFNIVHIGCFLYVLWAKRDPNIPVHQLDGPGHGYVSVFNLDGSFVRRFTSRGLLNSPWAMIPAPPECGFPPGSFIIGNHGNGHINVFDYEGRYVGPLINQSGLAMIQEGLWGLAPYYTDFNQIFWTASVDEDIHGMMGNFVKDQIIYL